MCSSYNLEYVISPRLIRWWTDTARHWGPTASGALFSAAWWIWGDAIALCDRKVPFDRWLPGLIAVLALIMINCIRRDDLSNNDPFDDPTYCRMRIWLFLSYIVSFAALVAAVWSMVANYSSKPGLTPAEMWPGTAGILQVSLILASALLFFMSRTSGDGEGSSSYDGYGSF